MNILFISHTAGGGGGETVLMDTMRTVANNTQHSIFVALPNDGDSTFEKKIANIECKIERFAFRPIRNTNILLARNLGYGILLGLPKLKRYIKDNHIDLVYVNSSVNVIGTMAARATKRPMIWHIHEQSNAFHRWAPKWFNKYYKKWFDECTTVFVSNTSYQLWLEDLGIAAIKNSEVVYSKYKEIAPSQRNEIPFTFGFIGSLNENKNIIRLIEAFDSLSFPCKLLIAGDGAYKAKIKEKADQHTDIELVGSVNNLNAFYSKIDCIVLPSLNESWGLVALEAMSANLPVVLTKHTGLTEILTNEKECLFVEPTNTAQIATAMQRIAQEPILREKLVANATRMLEEQQMNERFTDKILQLINGK